MSEVIHDYLPSETSNTENQPKSSIIELADKLDYINPAIFNSDDLMISEQRLVALRHSWLEQAEEYRRSGDRIACISILKDVVNDINHSGDHTHLEAARAVLESCYESFPNK